MSDLWPELVNKGMRSLLEAIWGYCVIVRCLWKTVINQEKPADVSPAVRLLDVPVVITQSQMFNALHTLWSPWFTAGKSSDWKLMFVRASARSNPRPQPEPPPPSPQSDGVIWQHHNDNGRMQDILTHICTTVRGNGKMEAVNSPFFKKNKQTLTLWLTTCL